MLKKSILGAALAAMVMAGCGSSKPDAAVRSFVDGYISGDIAKACAYYDQKGPGTATAALVDAAGDNRSARHELLRTVQAAKGDDAVCTANLTLLRKWDPNPRRFTNLTVKDIDVDGDDATVYTRDGEWSLHEVNGSWKLSNMDPVVPARLTPPPDTTVVEAKPDADIIRGAVESLLGSDADRMFPRVDVVRDNVVQVIVSGKLGVARARRICEAARRAAPTAGSVRVGADDIDRTFTDGC